MSKLGALGVQWGHTSESADKNVKFAVTMNVFASAIVCANDGTVIGNLKEQSVSTTGFSLWFWDHNQYNLETYWIAVGLI